MYFVLLQLVVVDVYNHRFHKVFMPNDSLTQILDRDDIFVCVSYTVLLCVTCLSVHLSKNAHDLQIATLKLVKKMSVK